MRKLTKKLFAAFAAQTNLIGKSTFTMQINVYDSYFTVNPYFTPCVIRTIRINKPLVRYIHQQKHSISFLLTL